MILEFASKIITASPRLAVWASASFIPLFSNARKGKGLQYPKLNEVYNSLFAILRQLGQPTDAQLALMRATVQGQRMDKSTEAYYQTQMFRLWYIRQLIQEVLTLLQ
jgi:hypothetical protein